MEVLQDTYKDTKIGRIPKDWEVKTLEDVFIFNNGKGHEQFISENGDYIVVNSKFISQEGRVKKFSNKQMSPLLVKDITMVMSDIPNGRALAKCFMIEENNKYSLNQRICGLRLKNDVNDNVRFFFYNLNRNKGFLKYNDEVSQTNLRKSEVLGCLLAYPPSNEQQKIAAILSMVDEQISTTEKIIEKSKELKKGLMQKLFSEGIGHTEFKDTKIGRIPKDWEVVKLGDVLKKIVGGGTPSKNNPSYWNGDIPWASVKDFTSTKKSDTIDHITAEGLKNSSSNLIPKGTIIIPTRMGLGRIIEFDIDVSINQDIKALFPKDIVLKEYLKHWFIGIATKIKSQGTGSTVKGIRLELLRAIEFILPPLPEQQKIADLLSEADAKIEKEQKQKAQLEQLKKGLMQELLTGKKRVKV